MTTFGWIYAALTLLGIFYKIGEVGKPRKPVTSTEAATQTVISILIFLAIYHWGLT